METESATRNGRTSDRSLPKTGNMFLVTNAPEQIVTMTRDWMFLRLCAIIWVCGVWTFSAIGNSLTFATSRPVLGRSTAIRKKCKGTSHLSSAQRRIASSRRPVTKLLRCDPSPSAKLYLPAGLTLFSDDKPDASSRSSNSGWMKLGRCTRA